MLKIIILLLGLFIFNLAAAPPSALYITGDNIPFFGDYLHCGFTRMVRSSCLHSQLPVKIYSYARGGSNSRRIIDDLEKKSAEWKKDGNSLLLIFGQLESHPQYGLVWDETRKNLDRLLKLRGTASIRIYLSSVTARSKDLSPKQKMLLKQLNENLKNFAGMHHLGFLDFAASMQQERNKISGSHPEAADQLFHHRAFSLSPMGELLIAENILKDCCGASKEQIAESRPVREKLYTYNTGFNLTTEEFRLLAEKAMAQGLTVAQFIRTQIIKDQTP